MKRIIKCGNTLNTQHLAGVPSDSFAFFMRIHENSAKQNANQCAFPSGVMRINN